jgi:hypothetical protein
LPCAVSTTEQRQTVTRPIFKKKLHAETWRFFADHATMISWATANGWPYKEDKNA